MELEVNIAGVGFVPATVISLDSDKAQVRYNKDWRVAETVKLEDCRLPSRSKNNAKSGDLVEALIKAPSAPVEGWQKARVRELKGDFVVVDSVDAPQPFSDVVDTSRIRALSNAKLSKIYSADVNVPDDLAFHFAKPEAASDYAAHVRECVAESTEDGHILRVSAFTMTAINRAKMLAEFYFKDERQKLDLAGRRDELERQLGGRTNNHNTQTHPERAGKVVEEFDVTKEFMGLVIGKQGANIQRARGLPGIVDIDIDETSTDVVHITEIVDKSGVVRVEIDEKARENGHHVEDESVVPFAFTGTREAIDNACFLVDYHVQRFREVEDLRASVEDVKSQYYDRSSPGIQRRYTGTQNGDRDRDTDDERAGQRRAYDDERPRRNGDDYVNRGRGRGAPRGGRGGPRGGRGGFRGVRGQSSNHE